MRTGYVLLELLDRLALTVPRCSVLASAHEHAACDPALLRSGRLAQHVSLPPPPRNRAIAIVRRRLSRALPADAPDALADALLRAAGSGALPADLVAACDRSDYVDFNCFYLISKSISNL